ncbi:two-component system, response regulator YesN [Paenibacillaceae bacterium GAS479]|nr:two-component system, response regulator YesN [Paenibacillaceae bacterium GAS479]
MWKILLVEDEVFVRRKLRKLIQWEKHGFTVAGEASDGEEALELIHQIQPELVITDIMMPGMDGLELLRQVRSEGVNCRFVMLTCMGEFEYARKALELGASGYVLKLSMSIAEMEDMLHKTGKEIERSTQQEQLERIRAFDRYYLQLRESLPLLSADGTASSTLAPPVPPAAFGRVCLLSVLQSEAKPNAEALIASGAVSSSSRIWPGVLSAEGVTTLFFWSDADLTVNLQALPDRSLRGVYSDSVAPSHLQEEWPRLLLLANERWYEDTEGIAETSAVLAQVEHEESPLFRGFAPFNPSWRMEKEIIAAFEQLRPHDTEAALSAYWREMRNSRVRISHVWQTARSLDRIFTNITGAAATGLPSFDPETARSHDELLSRIAERATGLISRMSGGATRQGISHPEINRILDYLERHYADNITLKAMSRLVSMDEHYLSRLFKQKTGETFICYLQKLRVKKAMLLLKETGQPISEIGRSVGFPNDNYFVKTFKKWGDVTPGQYRKMSQQA